MNVFIMSLAAANTTDGAAPSPLVQFFPIVIIFVIMYMLLIRPQQKKNKEHQELIRKIKAGDRVVTAGGIHGVVTMVKDKTIMIQVADGVQIEMSRPSIVNINPEIKSS